MSSDSRLDSGDLIESELKTEINKRISSLKKIDEKGARYAKRCNIPQTTMSGYLNDKRKPSLRSLLSIADSNEVSLDWLLTGRGAQRSRQAEATEDTTVNSDNLKGQNLNQLQRNRPSQSNINLRLIVEWMDEYFGDPDNEEESLFFVQELAELKLTFRKFLEKKQAGKDHQDTSQQILSANDNR